jgi:hypothetical protein
VAAGGGGFRAALEQLRRATALYAPHALPRAWTLADFQLAVDVTWCGQALLSALTPLSHFASNEDEEEEDDDDEEDALRCGRRAKAEGVDGGGGG